jgi:predicted AAA+ superfamily ATPase
MSSQDTAYFNGLLAAARGTGKEAMFSAVVRELKDMHVDDAKKWAALWEAIKQIRKQAKNQASPP